MISYLYFMSALANYIAFTVHGLIPRSKNYS